MCVITALTRFAADESGMSAAAVRDLTVDDLYVATSAQEGMPNHVLTAIAAADFAKTLNGRLDAINAFLAGQCARLERRGGADDIRVSNSLRATMRAYS